MAEAEFDKEVLSVISAQAPLSASRIERITKLGVKYGRNYKAVVFSIERLVTKCSAEHKLSALYIIDSVVRACNKSLHAQDYTNLVSRFEEKIEHMFPHMLSAPPKDKEKMKKLINIWKGMDLFNREMLEGIEMIYLPDVSNPAVTVLQATDSPRGYMSPIDSSSAAEPTSTVNKNDPRLRGSSTSSLSTTDSPSTSQPPPQLPVPAAAASKDPFASLGVDVTSLDPMTLIQTMSFAPSLGIDASLLIPVLVQSVAKARAEGNINMLTQVLSTLGEAGCVALGLDLGLSAPPPPPPPAVVNDFDYGDDEEDVRPVSLERPAISVMANSVP
ncbi:RNA binding protein Nrd1 [Podochytrium sp. JEL0797]|nr:RNA binding protein Nrd1 [Podochytrium sp. JEL0797]